MKPRVLVTGATGFLGGHVVQRMQSDGWEVFTTGSRNPSEWVYGMQQTPQAIVHLAWFAVPGSQYPSIHASCANSTVRFIRQCFKILGKRIPLVFPSTTSVYGYQEKTTPLRETSATNPNCSYTIEKLRVERVLRKLYGGMGLSILRIGSLMGRAVNGRERVDLVVNSLASQAYDFRDPVVEVWNPTSWKPVIHVKDCARIISGECERLLTSGNDSRIYNVASQCVTTQHIAQLVQFQTGCRLRMRNHSPRGVRSCYVDNSRIEEDYGGKWIEIPQAIAEWQAWQKESRIVANDPARW